VPCGFGQGEHARRPVGLQIIGNYFDEGLLLALADRYQQHTDWHRHKPWQDGAGQGAASDGANLVQQQESRP